MRLYYICPQDIVQAYAHIPHHYVDLDDGLVLVSMRFVTYDQQDHFEALPTVSVLPHPLDSTPIDDDQATKLKKIGAKTKQTTKEVVKLAKAAHRLM